MAQSEKIPAGGPKAQVARETAEKLREIEERQREIADRIGELNTREEACPSDSLFGKAWCGLKSAAEDFGRILTGGSSPLIPEQRRRWEQSN